jgi:hypothetical protein
MPSITAALDLRLELLNMPVTVRKGSLFPARVRLTNNSLTQVKSRLPHPVHLSYHCYSEAQRPVTFDGLRTIIPTVRAGSAEEIEMQLAAPAAVGRFLFRLTAVQEGVMWFDGPPQNLFLEVWLEVV